MKAKILLVEDDVYLREGLCELLLKEDYEPVSACNCKEGRKLFTGDSFDLVILDVMLPDGNGLDLCSFIRSTGADVPILFLTACDEEFDGKKPDEEYLNKVIDIYAPEKIGFSYTINRSIITWSLSNLSDTVILNTDEKALLKDLKAEADSPFKVGDILKLTLICSDENGKITREDKKVKIGAILGKKSPHGTFSVYTTLEGLDKFGVKFNYNRFDIEIKEECNAEIDEQMQAVLAAMFPGKYVGSAFAMNEAQKREYRSIVISVISLIVVFICVSIALINNSISAQIREGKRTIGTLRAVGASERELVLSYVMQIANILVCGFFAGTIIYVSSYRLIGSMVVGEYWPVALWPAFLVFAILALACYINLKVKIRMVLKHSIVENIREL